MFIMSSFRALPAVLFVVLFSSASLAQPSEAPTEEAPQQQTGDEPLELTGDEPLDLSTPLPAPGGAKPLRPSAKPGAGSGWDAKLGVDHRRPSFTAAEWQPEHLLAGSVEEQSTGVAWASVSTPGLQSPLGWDQTSIETRLDPAQDQGQIGATLSRSVPFGDGLAMTLQNGYSVTMATTPGSPTPAAQGWTTSQAVRFNVLPTDTTFSLGAATSSTDDKWLRSLSAEQKLLGGPLSVTGSVSETGTGDTAKSLRAGFKRTW
jgi:hypothetical protein